MSADDTRPAAGAEVLDPEAAPAPARREVRTLAAPVVMTSSGERLKADGSNPALTYEPLHAGPDGKAQIVALGRDGKPVDAAPDEAEPASPPAPRSGPATSPEALAAARRLIIGGAHEAPSAPEAPRVSRGDAETRRDSSSPSAAASPGIPAAEVSGDAEGDGESASPPTDPRLEDSGDGDTSASAPTAPVELGGIGAGPLQAGDDNPVDLRSEELDEILTLIPSALVRWGTTGVFVTLAVMLAIARFIAYPDLVKGTLLLTTPSPPARVVARSAGEVERVFVADRREVAAGTPLVLLKSPARYADVAALSAALERMEPSLLSGAPGAEASFGPRLSLGDLQPAYAAFLQAYSDWRAMADDPFHAGKVAALRAQVADHQTLHDRLQAQQAVQEQQLALAERARLRTRQMAAQQLVAASDADKAEQDWLQARYAVESGRTALTSNDIQLSASRAALLDLEQRRSDDGQRLLTALRNAHRQLRAGIAGWEQQYLVRAPVAGTASFFRELHDNQYVAPGEPLLAVVPSGARLVGRVQLSGAGAGKVVPGQRVIVRFDSYPHREYGVVEGRVESVAQLGFEQERTGVTYRAVVTFPHGLATSYGRRLPFRQELRGDVDVVTEDMTLLERVFNQFRSLRQVH